MADRDRPLSKRGRDALGPLREHVEGLGLQPDVVLCSDSRRTRETLDGIRAAIGRRARVQLDPELYGATVERLVAELRGVDDQLAVVWLIGHNPGLADLVDLLAAEPARGGIVIESFPTAAVAVLALAGSWSALQPASATLESFWTPRQPG